LRQALKNGCANLFQGFTTYQDGQNGTGTWSSPVLFGILAFPQGSFVQMVSSTWVLRSPRANKSVYRYGLRRWNPSNLHFPAGRRSSFRTIFLSNRGISGHRPLVRVLMFFRKWSSHKLMRPKQTFYISYGFAVPSRSKARINRQPLQIVYGASAISRSGMHFSVSRKEIQRSDPIRRFNYITCFQYFNGYHNKILTLVCLLYQKWNCISIGRGGGIRTPITR